jgi:hypothetical protein
VGYYIKKHGDAIIRHSVPGHIFRCRKIQTMSSDASFAAFAIPLDIMMVFDK